VREVCKKLYRMSPRSGPDITYWQILGGWNQRKCTWLAV
jgi:hypothetical protein